MSFNKGGYIPATHDAGFRIRELRPKEPGDIDDVIMGWDGKPKCGIRWNIDGTLSYLDALPKTMDTTKDGPKPA